MKVTQPIKNTLLLEFDTQKELIMMMFRIQEFYESPFENIRNKYFTVEEFIKTHMEDSGELDYFSKWAGFNIPGHIVKDFFFTFRFNLTDDEVRLKEEIEKNLDISKPFYVIAGPTDNNDVIDHEMAHALYYLDSEYKEKMLELALSLPKSIYDIMEQTLLDLGYCNAVINDEIQACLGTGSNSFLKSIFGFKVKDIKSIKLSFNKTFLKHVPKLVEA